MSAVLIIGASSAIGQALATHYLQQGLHVIWLSVTARISVIRSFW